MSQIAVIYARFSSAEQSKGYSLERQQTLGAAFADEHGWSVERTITDEGRSAFHGTNRLEGSALHGFELEAKNGLHRGKVLVVENIDRLSRQGAKAAAQLIWGLNEHGVDVATFHDQHVYRAANNADMMDLFKVIILAQQAHEESSKKSKRTAASWEKRFERMAEGTQKTPIPHTPHWVDKFDGKMVLNPKRTALLNEIYDMYIDGMGIHKIVTVLNARDEPRWTLEKSQRAKNGWFYSYIYRLLTKRTVLGEYVTMDGKIVSADFYPQAITAEKWNRAQAALSMRKANHKTTDKLWLNRNLLQGMVFCDQCGGGAHFRHQIDKGQTYTKKNGEVVTYKRNDNRRMRCDRARRKHNCDNGTILSYDVMEATVLNEMLPQLVDRQLEEKHLAPARERIAEAERLRDVNRAKLENLIDALADGSSKSVMQRITALEAEIEAQSTEVKAAQQALAMQQALPTRYDDATLILHVKDELDSEWDEVRSYARGRVNMALRRLIKRITITNVGTFRIEPDEFSSWHFDEDGKLLEGAWTEPLNEAA